MSQPDRLRLRLRCRGAVQGVGFRPTVHRLASRLGLAGWVANDAGGAVLEVEGPVGLVRSFPDRLRRELPPLAHLESLEHEELPLEDDAGFVVRTSEGGARRGALVPPDAALCADCRADMEDPTDRRHRYPFTTCTNCGPRFSLVRRLPYDRERTAMAEFPLCAACRAEYEDPADRRFHAEPVCCPACGPRLWLADAAGRELADGAAAIAGARSALLEGRIVAVKGLGGFQLACRADSEQVVARLRARKRRPGKPFAVMVRDLAAARRLVELTPADEALLASPASPVVLAPRRPRAPVADAVAPGLEDLGILLPTTPLHVEILRDDQLPPLVMTSGNLSEEPLCRANDEAVERLGGIADLFLLHEREVVRRVDDSVVRATPVGPVLVRRARGYVPRPLDLPEPAARPLLAVGGHLQVTACLALGGQGFPTQHVGDLDAEPARAFLREAIAGLEDFLQVRAEVLVADLHPDYPSAWLARELAAERGGALVEVQHHLAHAAAVLAEHGAFPRPGERVLGVSLDGTGFGPEGAAWGGEWLLLDGDLAWWRLAHLEPLPLIGGERAVREPWRVAVAALEQAGAADLLPHTPLAATVAADELAAVRRLAGGPWPRASGAGRLLEAAGALLGLAPANRYEGEAAILAEAAASGQFVEAWPELALSERDGRPLLPSAALLAEAARRLAGDEPVSSVAAGIHATFCRLAVELTVRVTPAGVRTVALGGGCMVNRRLLAGLSDGLGERGYEVLVARQVPPGDGGLAYGQAAVAAAALARGAVDRLTRPAARPPL